MSDDNTMDTTVAQAAPASPAKPATEAPNDADAKSADAPAAADATENASSAVAAAAADEASVVKEPANFDANVRVAKESSVRKLISFVMGRLERGGRVTLQALNLCVHKAITIALIVRDRLGNIHQVNSLLVVQETRDADKSALGADDTTAQVRSTSGIQIILSRSPLDRSEVGYEKPKPKGFANQGRQRRRPYRARQTPEDPRAAERTPTKKPSAAQAPPEKTTESKRGRREKAEAAPTLEAKETPQPRRKSRKARRQRASSAEQEPEKKPERKEQQERA